MAKKSNLPIEIHDHFRKANILNGYVAESLGTARDHALEAGQELMAAKAGCPPKSWEKECVRLFDGSLRTAQCYMAFARDFGKLKSAGKSALLMLEGTLEGAAKAAKKATAKPKPPPKPQPDDPIDVDSEPVEDTDDDEPLTTEEPCFGKCPNCAGTKWDVDEDGHVDCAKCSHPHGEPAGDVDEDGIKAPAAKPAKPKPPKKLDKKAYYKQWDNSIGPMVRLVSKIADGVGEKGGRGHKAVQKHLNDATEAMVDWMGVE